MRKLPLAALGAAAAVGLFAATAQAEPVPLTYAQMDQMTAGLVVTINLSAGGNGGGSSSCTTTGTGECTSSGSGSGSGFASFSFEIGGGDDE